MQFKGNIDSLKQCLASLSEEGEWKQLVAGTYQFVHRQGGILNWYPSTGTIVFQGKADGKTTLEKQVQICLEGAPVMPAKGHEQGTAPESVEAEPTKQEIKDAEQCLQLLDGYFESELVIGLVGAVGTELAQVEATLSARLKTFGYNPQTIKITEHVIPKILRKLGGTVRNFANEHERISGMMDDGDNARLLSGNSGILALGVAAHILGERPRDQREQPVPRKKQAYIIHSLKHPAEVQALRRIYPLGFYLIGVHSDLKRREEVLVNKKRMTLEQAQELISRDEDEKISHGQRVADTFHLSDFFVRLEHNHDQLEKSIWRFTDIIFSNPFKTPTFDEYAMFLAFAGSVRSADLSRQVGAVIARENEILSTGANDSPKFGGGLYWPYFNSQTHGIEDVEMGRDYKRGYDSNKDEQNKIINQIVDSADPSIDKDLLKKTLQNSRISELTEFGRVVHAEMEAILACGRNSISTKDATLYCTTFPCHNCAKHIVAAGIERVVYIEPYAKSKALDFHGDSIKTGFYENVDSAQTNASKAAHVKFEPFVGMGPRRFIDLFSMKLGSGSEIKRKGTDGKNLPWKEEESNLRLQMIPASYLDLEVDAANKFSLFLTGGK